MTDTHPLAAAPTATRGPDAPAGAGTDPGSEAGPRVPPVERALAWLRARAPRDWVLVDVAVAVLSFVGLTLPVLLGVPSRDGHPLASLALGAASTLPIAVRRRWPVPVLAVVVASVTASLVLGVRTTPFASNAGPGVALALYTAAVRTPRFDTRLWLLGGTCAPIGAGYGLAMWLHPNYEHNSFHTLAASAAWLVAENVRIQRCYRADLAERRRHEEDERARRAAAEERLRLSREVHDVVSHSLSVIAVQSGVGRMVAEERPAEARAALATIETTSRGALDELRRLLATTRDPVAGAASDAAPDAHAVEPEAADGVAVGASRGVDVAPVPMLADVVGLVERMAAGGLDVTLRYDPPSSPSAPGDLPASLEVSAYRIVQEALTNVVRHAGDAHADVTIVPVPGGLTIEVVDDGSGDRTAVPSGGFGLIGVRERVALFGGSVEAGPRPGGGFRLAAHLPFRRWGGERTTEPSEEPA
jgi:signal transduction histidine kinase